MDRVLTEALAKAIRDFGESILHERRLIGILKDLRAFVECQPAELIIRIMIESNSMGRFKEARTRSGKELEEFLLRETATHANQFGFSETWLDSVFRSVLAGIGCTEITRAIRESSDVESREAFLDPLDLRNIPRNQSYLKLQEELCAAAKGTLLTDYENRGKKYALFSCMYGPFRNVEVKVISENLYGTSDRIQITLVSVSSKDIDRLRNDVEKALSFLDSKYDINLSNRNLYPSSFSKYMIDNEFINAKYKDMEHALRVYDMKEGTVNCSILFRPNGYAIILTLTLRDGQWNPQPTATPKDEYAATKCGGQTSGNGNAKSNFAFHRKYFSRVRNVIAETFDIDIHDIKRDTPLYEIEEMGGDIEEMVNELEGEFGVFLDTDLIDEYMDMMALTDEIILAGGEL